MDRENVVSALEEIKMQTAEIGLDSAVIAHKFIDIIIAMLNEQEAVVRCKDCKYWRKLLLNQDGDGACHADNPIMASDPNWFCGDGIAKD